MLLMTRRDALKAGAAGLGVLAARGAAAEPTRVVTDHLGRRVTLPLRIDRAVVADIYPFASVAAIFLGGCGKLAGMSPVSMSAARHGILSRIYPDILKVRTDFMTGDTVNVEALLRLRPQVVFANASNPKTLAELEAAHIPVIAVSATKWNYSVIKTFDEWVMLLSQVFPEDGGAKAKAVHGYSASVVSRIRSRVSRIPQPKRPKTLFLFQYGKDRIVTSGSHFFGQYWCDAVGARNVASSIRAQNQNAVITMEQVYAWDPDLIFITNFTPAEPQDLYRNAYHDWKPVKAVREKQVFKMPLGTYRTFTPSADTPVTLLWLAKCAYPTLFSDINIEREAENYYSKLFGIHLSEAEIRSIFDPGYARCRDRGVLRRGARDTPRVVGTRDSDALVPLRDRGGGTCDLGVPGSGIQSDSHADPLRHRGERAFLSARSADQIRGGSGVCSSLDHVLADGESRVCHMVRNPHGAPLCDARDRASLSLPLETRGALASRG